MKPVSIINHNTIIPKNNSRYRESFNTVILPKDNIYKITSITCKIDTTSLWNIRNTNIVRTVNNKGQNMTYHVVGGYYTIDDLCNSIAKTIDVNEDNLAYVTSNCESVDLSDAPDVAKILKMEEKLYSYDGKVHTSEPYDITNGQGVIRIYSSIMKQTFGIKSSLIDNLIHVSIGLNNIITIDNLNIDVIDQSNLDSIEWLITDMNDNPISLNSNVYVSFTISCYAKN